MTWRYLLCVIVTIGAPSACASPKIGYDYDHNANFNAYHTYQWMPGEQEASGDKRVDNSLVDIRFRTAVGAQLRLKGYTPPPNGQQPDFYVAYHAGLKDMTPDLSSQYYSDGMAGRPFTYSADSRTSGQKHAPDTASQSYLTGTLLIDIIDAASNKLVWRSTASGAVDPGLTSEERDERTRTIVHKMLSHFPPP